MPRAMTMTKQEQRRQDHRDDLRRRVEHLERTRPEEPRTKDLRRSLESVERQHRDRAAFAADLGLSEFAWRGSHVSRLLRLTGERPDRVAELWQILGALGLGSGRWISAGGVFDHGTCWGRAGVPVAIVGHPYRLGGDERALLATLANYPTLAVAVDDRPSFYGHGTHHVRIWLPAPRTPFQRGVSTTRTRAAARAARQAFAAEGLPDPAAARTDEPW